MSITIVTTTRNRAFCFSLLEKWMANQTMKWDQWIVVNDGTEEYAYTMGQQVVERDPSGDTLPSICENWRAAIPLIEGDKVIVAEDDDWLHPEYVAKMDRLLDDVDLAGVSHDVYYKLPTRRFVRMHNANHASLACTAFRASLLPDIDHICKAFKNVFIDMILWTHIHTIEGTFKLIPQPREDGMMYHVGMKNMPGGKGLGLGHENPSNGSTDPNFVTLSKWIGPDDARVYRQTWLDFFSRP